MNFQTQFENLKKLNLPTDQFAVVSSGSLSVRGIRDSEDLDVIVTPKFLNELSKEYKVELNNWGIKTLCLENDIEILNPNQSIYGNGGDIGLDEIFGKADIFDGIKFMNLTQLRQIKLQLGREKDLRDVELIDRYLSTSKKV